MDRCVFNSTEPDGIEYIYSMYYQKKEYIRFSSSVGEYVGYTEFGVKNADRWNQGSEVIRRRNEKERYCLNHVGPYYENILTKSGESVLHLHLPHIKS